MIRFIHTADIHFGVENYGRIDAVSGIHSRLLDFARALNFCIDTAIEHDVDFFLFCGDAYKTHHPSQTQQRLLFDCLLRLYHAHIPIVIVIGNHDNPLSFGKAHALNLFGQLPLDGFYVIEKPQILNLPTKNGLVQIVGIPWPTRNTIALDTKHQYKTATEITEYISKGVSLIIQNFAQQLDHHKPAILAAHLTVSSGVFSGSEKKAIYGVDPILLPSQLAIPPFDYIALGHLHRYQNLNEHGFPPIIYSGSIERVDFGERNEDKGFCLVRLIDKGNIDHSFIKTPTRPFIQIEVKLDANDNQTQQIIKKMNEYPIDGAVIKIIYHVPSGKKDVVDLSVIERACARAHYIAGILPIMTGTARTIRIGHEKFDTSIPSLLGTYFDAKAHLKEKKNDLITKALELLDNAQQEQN